MADTKITALAAIATVDPAADVLPIVDISDTSMAASGTTKKITSNQILGAGGTATLASATITGDLTVRTTGLIVNTTGVGINVSPNAGLALTLNGELGMLANNLFYWNGYYSGGFKARAAGYSGNVYVSGTGDFVISNTSTSAAGAGSSVTFRERYRIDKDGVNTWEYVGGVAGTAMTLNSTGLGVGDAPSADCKLTVKGGAFINRGASGGASQLLVSLAASSGSNFGQISNTGTRWALGYGSTLTTVGTEALIWDSSGNVGIGVTPSAKLDVQTSAGRFKVENFGVSSVKLSSSASFGFTATEHQFLLGAIQAMTLDASGNLLVGKTATDLQVVGCELKANGTVFSTLVDTTNAAASSYQLYSTGAATYRFYVGMGGTVFATNTAISAISDARLKENVQDIDVGLGAILALKPRKFDWKAGKGKDIKGDRGFIAQEFEQVFPNLIDEWKDNAPEGEAPYKSVRQDLIPVLVKAIQELTARVQTLETR